MNTLNKIKYMFEIANIKYSIVEHSPTYTSQESATQRGDNIRNGAKAIVLKTDNYFSLIVMSASLKLDSKKVKQCLNLKKLRFATKEELYDMTGLVPGSVPPFGNPILPFSLYIDSSIIELEYISFNAGSLTQSISMSKSDYLSMSEGQIVSVSR